MKTNQEQELRRQVAYHWGKVKEGRSALLALYDQGLPLSAPEYIGLSKQVDVHGAALIALDQRLEELILAKA